jgi:hypothetical protein
VARKVAAEAALVVRKKGAHRAAHHTGVLRDGQDRRARLDQVDKKAGLSPRPKLSIARKQKNQAFDERQKGA